MIATKYRQKNNCFYKPANVILEEKTPIKLFLKMKKYILLLTSLIFCFSCAESQRKDYSQEDLSSERDSLIGSIVPTSIVRNVKQDSKGNIWVASWDGIFKYNGKDFENITKEVSKARFFSVLEDVNGNFWFSTIGSGVFHFDGTNFQNFTSKDGLADNTVMEIFEAKDKSIWFSTEGGVSKYDGRTFQNFTAQEGLPNNEVYSIAEDSQGRFWFATKSGIGIYNGRTITPLINDGKPFENVRIILKDMQGNIWFGGNDGLWVYKDGKLKNYSKSFIGYIYQDKEGNILTASKDQSGEKLIKDYNNKENSESWKISRYPVNFQNQKDGKSIIIKSNETMIFGILEDNNNTIWYGTLYGVKRIT